MERMNPDDIDDVEARYDLLYMLVLVLLKKFGGSIEISRTEMEEMEDKTIEVWPTNIKKDKMTFSIKQMEKGVA